MNTYYPDCWVVVRIRGTYRVLAGWGGGYLHGDSWKLNSGITAVQKQGDSFCFWGASGSQYICSADTYAVRRSTVGILSRLEHEYGAELLPETTDWVTLVPSMPSTCN